MKKNLKKKITKVLAISMAFSMIFSSNAFATPIDLVNSTEGVTTDTLTKTEGTDHFADEDTNVWNNGEIVEETRVSVTLDSEFIVTIPKDVILDGETGEAEYTVNAKGDIAGDQVLSVVPDNEFVLNENGGKNTIATVTQNNTEYTYIEMQDEGTNYPGSVKATLTAGEWAGKFVFNITFNKSGFPKIGDILENYSWDDIAAISEAGLAEEYFNIGDEKKITLNSTSTTGVNTLADEGETYTLQIIGFNHDNLTDGSGKAGITFQFKECIGTKIMNSSADYKGGWENSDVRIYLKNDFYNTLPSELKKEGIIKEVNKIADPGDKSTTAITIIDKIFLLSRCEVDGYDSRDKKDRQYELYANYNNYPTDNIKYLKDGTVVSWWLRTTTGFYSYAFFHYVQTNGYVSNVACNSTSGVAPAFCI